MILSGDVGGTKTTLALFSAPEPGAQRFAQTYRSRQHPGLIQLVSSFLADARAAAALDGGVDAACFGVAGPVVGDRVAATNFPWVIVGEELRRGLGIPRIALINDLEATGHGIPALPGDAVLTLNSGEPSTTANGALIAAGTGLGEAMLIREGAELRPAPSEGGHVDFAPRDEEQVELLRYLWRRWPRVSYDRVVCGSGLVEIYEFLCERADAWDERAWLDVQRAAGDPAPAIARAALGGQSALADRALTIFVSIYGAEAGNLALKVMALGGVYVGGGIAPKIRTRVEDGTFFAAFADKGRFAPLMQRMPVHLILEPRTAVYGAARVAARLAAG